MSPVGRPKTDNPKEKRFSIRLDSETERKIDELCKELGITKGEAIRRAIAMFLEQEKK